MAESSGHGWQASNFRLRILRIAARARERATALCSCKSEVAKRKYVKAEHPSGGASHGFCQQKKAPLGIRSIRVAVQALK
jgi:hypothetical protein